jgi:acetolactate decarboxylase
MTNPAHEHFRQWATAVYQTSTMNALLEGIYDGDVTIAELLTHGDFGLGTFNHLDGEMVVLDGVCHHLRSDGSATIASGDERTPFAAVLRFQPDFTFTVTEPMGRVALTRMIDDAVPSPNLIHAIRVTGTFTRLRTRTVMAQTPPYPPLTEATENEPTTDFIQAEGTLAGFRTPEYEQGISLAGFHLHFLDRPRRRGGHALDFELARGEIAISTAAELHLSLPRSGPFLTAHLSSADTSARIEQAEGG